MVIKTKKLTKRFGGVTAVDGVTCSVDNNTIVGLIGPNGSGKTTFLDLITGFLLPDSGEAFFKNRKIIGLKPYKIAQLGIGRTFQLTRVFRELTVYQNLSVATPPKGGTDLDKRVNDILKFVNLTHLKNELAKNLSYGQQKLLELARVLVFDPSTLLLDEPAGGVNPILVNEINRRIKELRDMGKSIVIVEHNMQVIAEVCDTVIVLDSGKKIAEGPYEKIRRDEGVIEAYLGRA